MGKLINRIPGLRLLISSLPGSALRMHVESLCKPRDPTTVVEALPGKLDIKRHSPSILYLHVGHDISTPLIIYDYNLFHYSIVENGESKCYDLIEAHKECMRKHGFNI